MTHSPSSAQSVEIEKFLKDVATQTPEKPDYWSSCGQCERNSERAQDLLEARAAASAHTIGEDAANVAIGEREAHEWAPARIWLQREQGEGGSHTWREDSVGDGDLIEEVEYVRAELTAEKVAGQVPAAWFYYEEDEFIRMYDSEEKAVAACERFGGHWRAVVFAGPQQPAQPAEPCKCKQLDDWKGFHHPLCDKAPAQSVEQDEHVACIAPACHQWDGTDTCTCERLRVIDTLKRVATALPVLKTMLTKEGLGGVDVAGGMLADIQTLLAGAQPAEQTRELPIMRKAFRVTETEGNPDPDKQRFHMRFTFRSMEELHAADDQWRAFVAQPADQSSTIPESFKRWFEREWASYQDKSISDGKITSMTWALKGYRAAQPVAQTLALTGEQRDAIHLALSFLRDKNVTAARNKAVDVIVALLTAAQPASALAEGDKQ